MSSMLDFCRLVGVQVRRRFFCFLPIHLPMMCFICIFCVYLLFLHGCVEALSYMLSFACMREREREGILRVREID